MSQEIATRGILGLRSSAGPLEDIAVKFGDGVTALYGKNGAGKTWLLRALEASLAGHEMQDTHILLATAGDSRIGHWLESLVEEQISAEPQEEGTDRLDIAVDRWFTRGGYHFRPGPEWISPTNGLRKEVLSAGLIALVPRGVGDPRWDVWVCAPVDLPKDSELQLASQQLLDDIAKTSSLMAAGTALYNEFGEGNPVEVVRALMDFVPGPLESWFLEDEVSMLAKAPLTSMDPRVWDDWLGEFFVIWHCGAPYRWLMHPLSGWAWDQRETAGDYVQSLGDKSGEMLGRMWNDGLPMPVARIGSTNSVPWHFFSEDPAWSPNDATGRALAGLAVDQLPIAEDEFFPEFNTFVVDTSHDQWVYEVETQANTIFQGLLQDAPALKLELRAPLQWLIGPAMSWTVEASTQRRFDRFEGWTDRVQVPVSELSTAERRWALISIHRALDLVGEGKSEQEVEYPASLLWPPPAQRHVKAQLMILDEPEAALHRAAERHMAAGLDLLTTGGSQVVVATHSPEILNRQEVTLVHVVREAAGRTAIHQINSLDIENSVAELGLVPSDLMGIYRIYLLVEGEHDDIVVSTLLADELAQARVKVVPMRGGAKLPSTVESQLLFDMTTAHIVALLDNVAAEDIEQTWQGAQERYLSSATTDEAIAFLASEFRSRKGDEYQWISTWLARALKKGVHERLLPFGLEAPDVIDYLPVEILVPNAGKSWGELRAEHDALRPQLNKAKGPHDFKSWLAKVYGADTSPARVRVAAEAVTEVPEDLRRLGYRLREISSRRM